MSQRKNVCYLIFYNLTKPEPIFMTGNVLIIIASKSINNFTSNVTLTYFTLQFFRVVEMKRIFTHHCCF